MAIKSGTCPPNSDQKNFSRLRWACLLLAALCGFAFPFLAGCSKKNDSTVATTLGNETTTDSDSARSSGVAIIDVNQIAAETGALTDINRELDKREADFNLILDGLRKIHLDELSTMEKEHGEKPTDEQRKELARLKRTQAKAYNTKWQETRLKLNTMKQKLDEAFLGKLRPIAKEIAEEKGLSVVIRNENVFCLIDQFDITPAVKEAYLIKFPQQEIAPIVETAEAPSRGGGFVPRK